MHAHTPERNGSSSRRSRRAHRWPWLAAAAAIATAKPLSARQDMVGPDGLRLVGVLPALVLHVVGSIALVLAPVLILAAAASWILQRAGRGSSRPGLTGLLLAAALVTTPLAVYHWRHAPAEPAGGFMGGYRPAAPEVPIASLEPPAGAAWPDETGYLDLPQRARGGRGVIAVRRFSTFPVYVKLCVAGEPVCPGLRHAVLYNGDFEFRDLPAGRYEVRYIPFRRPSFAGRSRPLVIGDDGLPVVRVALSDSPVFDSPRDAVVGLAPKDF